MSCGQDQDHQTESSISQGVIFFENVEPEEVGNAKMWEHLVLRWVITRITGPQFALAKVYCQTASRTLALFANAPFALLTQRFEALSTLRLNCDDGVARAKPRRKLPRKKCIASSLSNATLESS